MKCKPTLSAIMLLVVLLAAFSPVRADPDPAQDHKKLEPMEVRALLEKGQAFGSLPEGMVIRVGTCLAERKEKTSKEGVSAELRETWEFTSNQVCRIGFENGNDDEDNSTSKRVDSRPFDSKNICKELLEGQAIEIQAETGKGPEVAFAGSSYGRGSRSIQVVLDGETILSLIETNGPFLKLYKETDARAFGTLHEQLASQARVLFNPKNAEAKIN